jgi:hypothetical protein
VQSTDSAVKRNVSLYVGTSTSTLDSLWRISITRVIFINFPLTLTATASLIYKIALPQCLFWPYNYYHITVTLMSYIFTRTDHTLGSFESSRYCPPVPCPPSGAWVHFAQLFTNHLRLPTYGHGEDRVMVQWLY